MIKKRYMIVLVSAIISVLFAGLSYDNLPQASQATQNSPATIIHVVDPSPPYACTHSIRELLYQVFHETTLDHVEWTIFDPLGNPVFSHIGGESQYIGGMSIPDDWVEGEYRSHVSYFSVEQGLEAEAEVVFLVSSNVGNLYVWVFNDIDRDGTKDRNEAFLKDWLILARSADTGLETYACMHPFFEWSTLFESLVAGQYEISVTFPVRHLTTTYRGKSFQATVEAGETTIVFIGVHLLA